MSAGAAGITAAALIYLFSSFTSNSSEDENIEIVPDYAKPDIDFEFTQRFGKNKNNKSRPNRLSNRSQHTKQHTNGTDASSEDPSSEHLHNKKYSLLDPNNPNYTSDMKNDEYDDTMYDTDDGEEGFSTDAYYVPFRVNNARTKRKPDAPFMAMFAMYANKEPSVNGDIENNDIDSQKDEEVDDENGNEQDIEEEDEEEKKKDDNNNIDNGSSPPLNPLIPSHGATEMKLNPLDNLREQYNKRNIPQSLQPDALSNAFQSDDQKAIQNDLNEDDSVLNGIQQSIQMMTQNND